MPFYRTELYSRNTPASVLDHLRGATSEPVRPRSFFNLALWGSKPDAPFLGEVSTGGFHIRRNIRYRNSFLPRIRGQVVAKGLGSRITLTMYLHPLVAAFMLLWFTGVISFFLGSLDSKVALGGLFALFPLGMVLFGVALVLGGFIPEAIKARNLIASLCEADRAGASLRSPTVSR